MKINENQWRPIKNNIIKAQAKSEGLGHQLYAVAFRKNGGSLEFRLPEKIDFEGWQKSKDCLSSNLAELESKNLVPVESIVTDHGQILNYCQQWFSIFNPRQLLTLVTYIEIINDVKLQLQAEYEPDKVEAIATYLSLVLDRCADKNSRLSCWQSSRAMAHAYSVQHALNLMWNYPETEANNVRDS